MLRVNIELIGKVPYRGCRNIMTATRKLAVELQELELHRQAKAARGWLVRDEYQLFGGQRPKFGYPDSSVVLG